MITFENDSNKFTIGCVSILQTDPLEIHPIFTVFMHRRWMRWCYRSY